MLLTATDLELVVFNAGVTAYVVEDIVHEGSVGVGIEPHALTQHLLGQLTHHTVAAHPQTQQVKEETAMELSECFGNMVHDSQLQIHRDSNGMKLQL